MADQVKAAKQGEENGRAKDDGEEGGKAGEEEVKKRRGRPPKTKAGDKNEEKESGSLRKYLLEKKSAGDDNGIEKGKKELARTPVKKIATGSTAAEGEDKEEDSGKKENEMAAVQGEKKTEGDGAGRTDGEEELENDDVVSVSENVGAWMRGEDLRIRAISDSLEKMRELMLSKAEEIKQLKEENRCRDIVIEGLQRKVVDLNTAASNNRLRIEELERWKADRDKAEKREENKRGGIGVERGDNNNNSNSVSKFCVRSENVSENEESGSEDGDGANRTRCGEKGGEGEGDGRATEKCDVVIEREYLKCKPTALSENEFNWEMEERRRRKKNIRIRGIRTVGKGLKEEVKNVIRKFLGIEVYIDRLSAIGGGLLIELESLENKIDIIKRKGMLKGINLWIEDDLTEREKEVQEWLGKIAEEERVRGLEVIVGHLKIKVDGDWYKWDERKGGVEQMLFRGKKQGNNFRLVSWNIAGIRKIGSVKDYLSEFDLIALQETWLEKEGESSGFRGMNKEFRWTAKAAVREKKKGRAKGGVAVGVRKGLRYREIIEWGFGLVVKELCVDREKKNSVIIGYNNGKVKEVIEELRNIIEDLVREENTVLLMGDFNARIGNWKVGDEGELEESRSSVDEVVNCEGKKLLDFCEEIGGKIKNGDTKGDWKGKPTFVGGEGSSVLDLVIEIENEKGSIIEEIKVEPRIESDHLPVEIYVERKGEQRREKTNNKGEREFRLKWDGEKREEYYERMVNREQEIGGESRGIQERWDIITKSIWEVGRELKMVKEIGGNKWEGERDEDIREQKRKVWAALRKWVKTRREEDREELKEERKRLRQVRRDKKEEEREEKRSRIEKSRTMSDFWKAIREFRGRRKRKGDNIGKEKWEEHFKGLLGGETEEGEEEREDVDGKEGRGGEEGKDEVEVEDEAMDREISMEEVQRAIGGMKSGKAAGEDGIVVEFLKYLPISWTKELAGIINDVFLGKGMIRGWEVARIYPIHKGGDEDEVGNYRGVSLLDSGYKILAVILERRLRGWLEKNGKIGESQAGFREKKGNEGSYLYS